MLGCSYRIVSVMCFAALLNACAGMTGASKATTNYDHSYDFSDIHTIAIQPIAKDTLSTMLMSDAQINRIRQALSDELLRRGFQVVSVNAEADIFLSWKFVPKESYDTATYDPESNPVAQGMLYVNMIDPIMLQSVWRSSFNADLREPSDTPAAAQYRQAAAQAILADFPPDPGAK